MYDTTYHKASSAADASALISKADDAKLLAGGQTLIPTMKQRLAAPSDLVDISGIDDLKGITVAKDGTITIGAMTTHAQVAGDGALTKSCPALSGMAGNIGDAAVRHRGTLGGSIANNDPAADYPAAMLALQATITTNQRSIAADDFFEGLFTTALEEDEVITSVSFKAPAKAGYGKFPNPASRYAMVGVFVAKSADGEVCVTVTGAGDDGVFRHEGLEQALAKDWSADAAAGVKISADNLMSDMHANTAYRANLISVMAKRAVAAS